MKNILIIIQARLTSKRLPGKLLLPLLDIPSIVHQYKRIKSCKYIKNCVVAIPDNKQNNKLE